MIGSNVNNTHTHTHTRARSIMCHKLCVFYTSANGQGGYVLPLLVCLTGCLKKLLGILMNFWRGWICDYIFMAYWTTMRVQGFIKEFFNCGITAIYFCLGGDLRSPSAFIYISILTLYYVGRKQWPGTEFELTERRGIGEFVS